MCIDPKFIVRPFSRGQFIGKQYRGPVITRFPLLRFSFFLCFSFFPLFPCSCPCFIGLSFHTAFCAVSHHLIACLISLVLYALSLGRWAGLIRQIRYPWTLSGPLRPVVHNRDPRWARLDRQPLPFVGCSAGLPRFFLTSDQLGRQVLPVGTA